jgi:hypothetical protein
MGQTLTFIDPSFTLTTYSISQLFTLAAQCGHYSSTGQGSEKLEKVRYLLGKVEYCRDVLRTLSQRKAAQQAQKEKASASEETAGKST